MMTTETATFDDVRDLIVATLGLEADRRETLKPWTPLFGGIPEFDSLAVVTLAAALEQHFGFEIDGEEFTAEIFDTVGSLSDFVDRSRH
ncbi:MAG: acyl carrier protein [Mesorhizobium sp.]|nr:acyl carrier protein [Mesorhizobium sp.]